MMNPLIQLKRTTPAFLIGLLIVCLGLSPKAQAVSPPPDGGYPNENTAEGEDALLNLTSGAENTAIGFEALLSNTESSGNTAIGFEALFSNTTGNSNTANGWGALFSNTTGFYNTANGVGALGSNISGHRNTANGYVTLGFNTSGSQNTANGSFALLENTTGFNNTANGTSALENNSTGNNNTANGWRALILNNADNNTANGSQALFGNTSGSSNTASGKFALVGNTTGSNNTADGDSALYHNTTGSGNTALGAHAGWHLTTGDNNIDIGNQGVFNESNTIRIGTQGTQTKTFIAGISGAVIGGMEVRVNQNGRLGIEPSSKRFKDEIKPMDRASEAILALKPVTFRYKKGIDPLGTSQFGLVAEDVEKVNPDLVVRDKEGKPYTVRYDQVNAMLLNEFLKEHRKNEEQEATIARQQKQIDALTAGLQKVSAQLEMNKSAPQVVNNP
jgi:trimeric autotransporter adhesin